MRGQIGRFQVTSRPRQLTHAERAARFPLDFDIVLGRNGRVDVQVPLAWQQLHLVRLGPYHIMGRLTFCPRVNINAAPVFSALFEAVKAARLLGDILTFDGGWVARLKRGATLPPVGSSTDAYDQLLSSHSRGTAVDLNARWNPMGAPGAAAGEEGSLHRIIDIAHTIRVEFATDQPWSAGIVCGADWHGASQDSMHFEVGTWDPA